MDRSNGSGRLAGRVALITGGSKGLGMAMARGLAEAGADIVISSRHESELRSAVEIMKPEEAAVLALLRGRLAKQAEQPERAKLKKLSSKRRAHASRCRRDGTRCGRG